MQLDDIKKLALMARVDMDEAELQSLATEFEPILAYVSQVQEVNVADSKPSYMLENVMRDDVITNTPGQYSELIIGEMPDTQDGFLKVKQIL